MLISMCIPTSIVHACVCLAGGRAWGLPLQPESGSDSPSGRREMEGPRGAMGERCCGANPPLDP